MRRGVAHRSTRLIAVAATAVTITATGAACSRSGSGSGNQNSNSPAPATSKAANPGDFGTLTKICGPGNATGGSGRGITTTSIQLGTMADPGSTVAPGLGEEFFQVGDAFVKWCNAAGGINGRKIALTDYDAKLFNVAPEMIPACQKVSCWSATATASTTPGAKPRTDCKLGQIPSYFVSPAATAAPYQVQPTPNPPDEFQVGPFRLHGPEVPGRRRRAASPSAAATPHHCVRRVCAPVTQSRRSASRLLTTPSVRRW